MKLPEPAEPEPAEPEITAAVLHCDGCGDRLLIHQGSPQRAARSAGWRSQRFGREWLHLCWDCDV